MPGSLEGESIGKNNAFRSKVVHLTLLKKGILIVTGDSNGHI